MSKNLKKLSRFLEDNFPTFIMGEIAEINTDTVVIKIFIKELEVLLPASLLLNSTELSFVPEIGTAVVVGFINKKFDNPVVFGALNSFDKEKISLNGNITINKTTKKIAIKNETASLKEIWDELFIKLNVFATSANTLIPNTLPKDITELQVKLNQLLE